jgi:hypothetical protein
MFWDSGHVLGQRSCFGTAVMFFWRLRSDFLSRDSGHAFGRLCVVLFLEFLFSRVEYMGFFLWTAHRYWIGASAAG